MRPTWVRLVEGLRGPALHIVKQLGSDKLASSKGPEAIIAKLTEPSDPDVNKRHASCIFAGAKEGGAVSRQWGEPLSMYILRRRSWWSIARCCKIPAQPADDRPQRLRRVASSPKAPRPVVARQAPQAVPQLVAQRQAPQPMGRAGDERGCPKTQALPMRQCSTVGSMWGRSLLTSTTAFLPMPDWILQQGGNLSCRTSFAMHWRGRPGRMCCWPCSPSAAAP